VSVFRLDIRFYVDQLVRCSPGAYKRSEFMNKDQRPTLWQPWQGNCIVNCAYKRSPVDAQLLRVKPHRFFAVMETVEI
jgi:hypothetical protein